jgi:hypothetical protein
VDRDLPPAVVCIDYEALSQYAPEERLRIIRAVFYGPLIQRVAHVSALIAVVSGAVLIWRIDRLRALSTMEVAVAIACGVSWIAAGHAWRVGRRWADLGAKFLVAPVIAPPGPGRD